MGAPNMRSSRQSAAQSKTLAGGSHADSDVLGPVFKFFVNETNNRAVGKVLSLLNEIKDTSVSNSSTGNQLATILYEATQHLQNSCGSQTSSDVRNLLESLIRFPVKLTHNEKLMIVNTPPKTALELSLIVHNYDERMTDEQVEELIEIINNTSS